MLVTGRTTRGGSARVSLRCPTHEPHRARAARPGVRARTRIVMLPAAFSKPQDFVQRRFRRGGARAPTRRRSGICRACAPARQRPRHPDPAARGDHPAGARTRVHAVAGRHLPRGLPRAGLRRAVPGASSPGLCLLAPYLGSHLVTAEIERAEGLAHWRPGPLRGSGRGAARLALHRARCARDPLPVHLGLGREDRFGRRHRLLAAALAPDRVDVVPGGSRLAHLGRLWERFLDTRLASHTDSRRATPAEHFAVMRHAPGRPSRMNASARRPWHALAADSRIRCAARRRRGARHGASALVAVGARRGASPTTCCSRRRALAAQPPARARTGRTCPPPSRRARAAVAITIDDGPDPEVTPRVLDLLDEHGARATFFCIGERVERYPALARDIVARQHEIGNHSYRHPVQLLAARAARPRRARSSARSRRSVRATGESRALLPRAGWPAQPVSRAGAARGRSCSWSAGPAAASTPSTAMPERVLGSLTHRLAGRRYPAAARWPRGAHAAAARR